MTGVDFNNRLYEDERLNIITYEYFYNGAGVGIGDINNDGLPDLFFAANMENCRLYLNKGGFHFEDITQKAGIKTLGKWAQGVSMVDINADGLLDIYVSFSGPYPAGQRKNMFFINQGDLTFSDKAEEMGLADTAHTTQALFWDYDRDGDLDAYLVNNTTDETGPNVIRPKRIHCENPNTDKLYKNENGKFIDLSREAGICYEGYGLGVSTADFNRDGYPDLYITNDYLSNDLLFINNRNGTFSEKAAAVFSHTSYSAMGHDIGDINRDGWEDVIAVDMLPPGNLRRKLMFNSAGYDRHRSEIQAGYFPQYVRNTLQLNQGLRPDSLPVMNEVGMMAGIHSTDWSWSALLGDFDQDGWEDLFISNGYPRDITNLDFVSYKANEIMRATQQPNLYGKLYESLQKVPGAHLPNYFFQNRKGTSFKDLSRESGISLPSYSTGAAYGDLDLDGDLDLVINNTYELAHMYENRSPSSNYLKIRLSGPDGNPHAFGASLRLFISDSSIYRSQRVVRGYLSSVDPIVHAGLGKAQLVDSMQVVWPDGTFSTYYSIESKQTLDIRYGDKAHKPFKPLHGTLPKALFKDISRTSGIDFLHEEKSYPDFKIQSLLQKKYSQQGPPICTGDINQDGLEDFYIGGAFQQSGRLYIQQADATFRNRALSDGEKNEEDTDACFFDADGDKDLDLYVVSGGNEFEENSRFYQDRLYLNDGKGNFSLSPKSLPVETQSGSCVAPGDFDGDGDLDLFIGSALTPGKYPKFPKSLLFENREGRFVDVSNLLPPPVGMISDAKWADLDKDGLAELIIAGEWTPICIYSFKDGVFIRQDRNWIPAKTLGWWNSLETADMDGDGDIDILAGNIGLNVPYATSPDKPVCLYIGDYNKDGTEEGVICAYLQGSQYPIHFRDDAMQQIFAIKKKYPTYTLYAEARWEDMFPGQSRDTLIADTFESLYLENLGNGSFRINALPYAAQQGPIQDFLVGEFTGDQYLDVFVAGGDYGAETHTGNYDALKGLLLKGDGRGRWKALTIAQSGIYIPGDTRTLALLRVNPGKSWILAGVNGEKTVIFERQ